jgi:choline-sulfatase
MVIGGGRSEMRNITQLQPGFSLRPSAPEERADSGRRGRQAAAWRLAALLTLAWVAQPVAPQAVTTAPAAINLVLLTLDTTRADHLGCYGGRGAHTPALDALAARGTRYRRALSPAPLTLPAHCTLLTGLDPPEHGVRDNGTAVLPAEIPTLATRLAARGYATAAFVSSRVLDRRFGLARGFEVYDDHLPAEQIGEYGYPERDAAQVTTAALAWLQSMRTMRPLRTTRALRTMRAIDHRRPFFLWVHYYDPHSPYAPPAEWWSASEEGRYAGEIAYMDSQIGRLLRELPAASGQRLLIAAVGDHGEALGEHGERTHGLFLYRASLEVPLILAGTGVPAGRVVDGVVATRRLAPTLLGLLGGAGDTDAIGQGLGGLGQAVPAAAGSASVFSETRMPATEYRWSALESISEDRWRLIVAPRPELYDVVTDPREAHNLYGERPAEAARLRRALAAYKQSWRPRRAPPPAADAALGASLRALGYVSGAGAGAGAEASGGLDPKDGIVLLGRFELARGLLDLGRFAEGERELGELVQRSPDNVPFLTQLARAQLARGHGEAALATYRQALALNPTLDFLHLNLADALRTLRRQGEAREEYEAALRLDPRCAAAWLQLGKLAADEGRADAARALLRRATEAGTDSAVVFTRLAELEIAAGMPDAAAGDLEQATRIAPGWAPAWLRWGELAERQGSREAALARYLRAAGADPRSADACLHVGRLLLRSGVSARARRYLDRAVALEPGSAAAREASLLLGELR